MTTGLTFCGRTYHEAPRYVVYSSLHALPATSSPPHFKIPSTRTNLHHVKGKAVPLQAWSGPEGSRKLRFPDFVTTAQGGGKVVSLTHRPPLPPGNAPGTRFC